MERINQNRLPPQNLDAEKAILGSIMLRPGAIHEITDLIRADSFYAVILRLNVIPHTVEN